jgi:hypothetical protein
MRVIAFLIISAVAAGSASAQTSQTRKNQPEVIRSVSGTVIQPTRTIIHNPNGTTTIITVPRRSYLNPGTEVPVGYGSRMDYAFPPGGDPGRPYWFYGPDLGGIGGLPLAQPNLIPGYNPNNPY